MASEFWFFGQLHRLGYQAFITLGNTKAVDIAVTLNNGTKLTFDVKGKESFAGGTYQYLPRPPYPANHFFAFVGLEIRRIGSRVHFSQPDPVCYIVEASQLPTIAFSWTSSMGTSSGFGFAPTLLPYLKSGGNTKKPGKQLQHFIAAHSLAAPIPFSGYQISIMSLQDFDARFHPQK
jgi:hypothetical protein